MSNWRPLKRFCVTGGEYGLNISSDAYRERGVRLLRTSDIGEDGHLRDDVNPVWVEPEAAGNLILQPGDILFSRSGTLGRAYVHHGNDDLLMTFAAYLVRFTPRAGIDYRYLKYCSQATFFTDQIAADAVVSTIANFNAERYGELSIPWHAEGSQAEIADFLDVETARIDILISNKRRIIELALSRANQSLSLAMGRLGFDFPSSLTSECSQIVRPKKWTVMRLGQALVQLTNGYVGPTRDVLVDSGVRYIQSMHIKDGRIEFHRRPFFVSSDWHSARPRIHLKPGDVLIVQTGDIGQVAVVPEGFGPASCHALQIARVRRDLLSGEYLAEYLRTPFGYQSLLSRATGALHPHLEGGIRDIPIVIPPIAVQQDLLNQVAKQRTQYRNLCELLTRQIELLGEHRQALITAAVTGELKVSGRLSVDA